jgi:hypothetical protein
LTDERQNPWLAIDGSGLSGTGPVVDQIHSTIVINRAGGQMVARFIAKKLKFNRNFTVFENNEMLFDCK